MKKIRAMKGWSIYEATKENEFNGSKYAAYLPDESPRTLCDPEWTADNVQEIIDFIRLY